MPKPEEITIQAKNIDAAAGEIIGVLEDTRKRNVIFVGGWHGFGASAALKVVAQRLKSSKSQFDRVVHVDFSLWKSMRALQKAIAEELELPPSVMAIFDWCDVEDDFSGMDEGSRGVIADISTKIYRKLANSRFVVIFHNGSDKYIDLYECGVPVIPILDNRMLWTWHGRFRPGLGRFKTIKEQENMEMHTDVVINYCHDFISEEALSEEAKEVVTYMGNPGPYMDHMIVEKCFQYAYALASVRNPYWVNWLKHASNYLVCDGIIQGQGDTSAWGVADALQRNMRWDWLLDSTHDGISRHLQCRLHDRWALVEYKKGKIADEAGMVLSETSSYFAIPEWDRLGYYWMVTLPNGIFQHSHSSKLRVLHLSLCSFSFESPPFLCCSQLRFLQLNVCTNTPSDKHPSHNEDMSCFQKLWVLHLCRTNWYRLLSEEMMNFMADLRELDVELVKDWSIRDLRGRFPSLVKVQVEESFLTYKEYHLPDLSSARFLKTVILADCSRLEQVVPSVLPPWLESFIFRCYRSKISSISFRGCSQLKSILLRGDIGSLEELDLSGTAVKTLDLREVETPKLKRLILLGCEKLCAILWPPENKRSKVLEALHIDTTRSTSPGEANWEEKPQNPITAMGSSSTLAATATEQGISQHESFGIKSYISARDRRILRSLEPVKGYIEHSYVYIEMDSSPASSATVGDSEVAQGIQSRCQPHNYSYARDVFFQSDLQAAADNKGAISWMWDCPASPTPRAQDLYLHIQDKQEVKRGLLQQKQSNIEGINISAVLAPSFIVNNARMLHVHDNSSITCITCPQPQGSCWRWLEWCRVERCPELRTVFYTPQPSEGDSFCYELATFWASELPKARYMCERSAIHMFSFVHIVLLHLDHCPRLIHVLPLSESVDTLPHLDTLEIVCCGDLREVFALDREQNGQKIMEFPKLRRIHLYELPSLQHICGSRMFAPNLKTIKIRGCWSLRSLPAVSRNNEKLPSVDCEKDWWDNLEWDGVEANHHPSLYEHSHSAYFKAQQQRGTVLR